MTASAAKPSAPMKKRPLIERAKDLATHGKVEQAKSLLDKILVKEPGNAQAWYLMGYVYQDMAIMDGGNKRAKDCYLKTISIDPNYSEAYRKLGELAGIDGNWQESIKFCTKALACRNPDFRSYKNRAIAKSNLHLDKEALADFELFKREMPLQANGPRGMDEYATFLENAGRYEQAIKTLEVLEKYDSRPSLPVRRAKYYVKAGKPSEGIAILNRMITKEPEDETLYVDRAGIFTSAGKLKEALKDWDKAIELQPTSKYYESRAALLDKLGNPQKAKADRLKAIERD
ncbi:tetratricopeptide repeat protein [bacterium]|nr:tetratricopeptide repeat protein [bacterium]MBP9808521.1 tetratricopeptide repeat protein [bacterium]